MSDHHSHKEQKKHRKLAQLLKNRRTQRINLQEDQLARERDRDKEERESLREAGRKSARGAKKEADPAWSARMQEIRDRTTGKKRMAEERWNRFAGTNESGGRGL